MNEYALLQRPASACKLQVRYVYNLVWKHFVSTRTRGREDYYSDLLNYHFFVLDSLIKVPVGTTLFHFIPTLWSACLHFMSCLFIIQIMTAYSSFRLYLDVDVRRFKTSVNGTNSFKNFTFHHEIFHLTAFKSEWSPFYKEC